MAHGVRLADHVRVHDPRAEFAQRVFVQRHRQLAFFGIDVEEFARQFVVDDDDVAQTRTGSIVERADVRRGRVAVGLAGLRHDVTDVDLDRVRRFDLACDAVDQQVGHDRGVERAGAEHDRVCLPDGSDHFVERRGERRIEKDPLDRPTRERNVRFALDDAAVGEPRTQP